MNNIFILSLLIIGFLFSGCQTTSSSSSKGTSNNSMTDSRDQQTYATISIGTQIWMAENLRYETKGSWLNPKNPTVKYGRLYNWETAKKACPKGWHLPTDTEWQKLEVALGMSSSNAKTEGWRGELGLKMKSKTGWNNGSQGDNSSGFNVLPTGDCSASGKFLGLGSSTSFWSATSDTPDNAWNRHFDAKKNEVNRYTNNTKIGLSCRCIKD